MSLQFLFGAMSAAVVVALLLVALRLYDLLQATRDKLNHLEVTAYDGLDRALRAEHQLEEVKKWYASLAIKVARLERGVRDGNSTDCGSSGERDAEGTGQD